MGRIIPYSDIENGLVPMRADFLQAKNEVLDLLVGLPEYVCGAKVFGSVGYGTPNERSDLDLLIIAQSDTPSFREYLKKGFDSIHDRNHVSIEPIVISRRFAQTGMHSIDRLFYSHVKSIPPIGNTAGEDPMTLLKPNPFSVEQTHRQYMAQKMRRLNEGIFTNSEEDKRRVLQRSLEAPINVGRRTLQSIMYQEGLNTALDDGKDWVVDEFKRQFGNTPLAFRFDYLLSKDKEYTAFLRQCLQGGISEQEYNSQLRALEQTCIPEALLWTTDMAQHYMLFLETRTALEGSPQFQRKEIF